MPITKNDIENIKEIARTEIKEIIKTDKQPFRELIETEKEEIRVEEEKVFIDTIKIRLEGIGEATKRSRLSFLVSTIASCAILITLFNAYCSTSRQIVNYDKEQYVKKQNELDNQKKKAPSEDSLSITSDFPARSQIISTPIEHNRRVFITEWIKNTNVSVGLLGLQINVNEFSILGSTALTIISFWLFFSLRRENRASVALLRDIYLKVNDKKADSPGKDDWNIVNLTYQGIVHRNIFMSSPSHNEKVLSFTESIKLEINLISEKLEIFKEKLELVTHNISKNKKKEDKKKLEEDRQKLEKDKQELEENKKSLEEGLGKLMENSEISDQLTIKDKFIKPVRSVFNNDKVMIIFTRWMRKIFSILLFLPVITILFIILADSLTLYVSGSPIRDDGGQLVNSISYWYLYISVPVFLMLLNVFICLYCVNFQTKTSESLESFAKLYSLK